MTRAQQKLAVVGSTAFMVALVATLATGVLLTRRPAFFNDRPQETIDEVWHIIDNEYVDGTFNQLDWQAVRAEYLKPHYSKPADGYKAIRAMLGKLGDPYTRFMDPDEFKNMQIDTSGELTGVGIQLTQDEATKDLVVVSPMEQTPADKAGIHPRDVIIAIDGQSTKGMDMEQAVKLIRGPVNSEVTLRMRRGTTEKDYRLTRSRIEIHPVRYTFNQEGDKGVGYIRLNQFNANAASEMETAIETLEKRQVKGYILDLRSNPGGLLHSSIAIARMWLTDGIIVSTVNRRGTKDQEQATRAALTQKPLVVLVDGGSASASEILSGALQDNKRAMLVGTTTFGKGLVQSVRPLGDGSGMAVTIAKYLTPNGRDIHKHGIAPDVVIGLSESQREALGKNRDLIGTASDPQYAKALEVLDKRITAQGQGEPKRSG
jgi:carboxyl-terminal processing protease